MHLLRLFLLLLLPLLALNAAAQTPTAPAADDLRSRLAALAERKLPEADQRAARMAVIARTTISSTSVKPFFLFFIILLYCTIDAPVVSPVKGYN